MIQENSKDALGNVQGTATFSEDKKYRYTLSRLLNEDYEGSCFFVMLNPSTADAFELDNTVRRCVSFARKQKMKKLVVLNLFALRSTDPNELYKADDPVGPHNDYVMEYTLGRFRDRKDMFVFAWGTHGKLNNRSDRINDFFRSTIITPFCFGKNKDGSPKHPLYLSKDSELKPYYD